MFDTQKRESGYTEIDDQDLFYAPTLRTDMVYVDDYSIIEPYLPDIKKADVLYCDTETTPKEKYKGEPKAGLDPYKADIRLLQIGIVKEQPLYFLIDLFKFRNSKELASELMDTPQIKVFQNAKFDFKMFKGNGIRYSGVVFDTMLAAQLLVAGIKEKGFSLVALVKEYLNIDISKKQRLSDWSLPELSMGQKLYALHDIELLIPLRKILRRKLIEERLAQVAQIEFDCIYGTVEMEYHGMKVDEKKLNILIEKYTSMRNDAAEFLRNVLGEDVNINAPTQLKDALNATYTMATGEFFEGTNNEALFPYRNTFPAVRAISQYRMCEKYISTYCNPLIQAIHPITKRVHCTYWPLGTKTGRFACSDPNLQNIPKRKTNEFRECFIVDEGNAFLRGDYGQVELRAIAHIANDRKMIEAYKNKIDLHSLTGSLVSGVSINNVSPEIRQSAKAVNFGLIFGMFPPTLKEYALMEYGVNMSLEEATVYREKFFKEYKDIAEWHKRQGKLGQNKRRTFAISGRRRLWNYRPNLTEIFNAPVQATASDCMKIALGVLGKKFKDSKDIKMTSTTHDEVTLEVPQDKAEEMALIMEEVMIKSAQQLITRVPIEVDVSIGKSWGECH